MILATCLRVARRRSLLAFYLISLACFLALIFTQIIHTADLKPRIAAGPTIPQSPPACAARSLVEAVALQASADRWIVLSMTDEAFVDMALNMHEASFVPNNITNFLFVGVGRQTCEMLCRVSVACFFYADDPKSLKDSVFGSADFNRKMNYRTDMILEVIAANFTVLHTDTDVAFLANPLQDLKTSAEHTDVCTLWDHREYNAGFIVIRPTPLAHLLYSTIRNITAAKPKIADQIALTMAADRLRKSAAGHGQLRLEKLNSERYACGVDYFEAPMKAFAICDFSQTKALVVHNNWIVGKAAKVYRFREHLMWMHDPGGKYYANPSDRFIMYDNIEPSVSNNRSSETVTRRELASLRSALALGFLLDRVIILPIFHCGPTASPCPLNSLLRIAAFDKSFAGRYKEHSFLRHPKVPAIVKSSAINANTISWPTDQEPCTGRNRSHTARFDNMNDLVLRLSPSVLDCFPEFPNVEVEKTFNKSVTVGFVRAPYRQYL